MEQEWDAGAMQNQMVRIQARFGGIDEETLTQDFEGMVYPTFEEWTDAQTE
jgi:hypothetical protein